MTTTETITLPTTLDEEETINTRGIYSTFRTTTDSGLLYITRTGRWGIRKDGTDPTPWTLYQITKTGKMNRHSDHRTSDLGLLHGRRKDLKTTDGISLNYGTGRTIDE